MNDWHLHDVETVVRHHDVNPEHGLHEDEVSRRALQHGPNVIESKASRGLIELLVEQLKDFMVLVLIAAAVISGFIGDIVDTLVILAIVLLNTAIGFAQSWQADRAMAALKKLATAHATVLRGGQTKSIPASELVPGDIVLLESGNQIPADLRLIHIAKLKIDESALTGESVTVEKHTLPLTAAASSLGDRLNMAFKGTTATHGRGAGLVVATGMVTELGKVAGFLDQDSDRSTPLQLRLAILGKRLALAVIAICIVVFLVGVLRGEPPVLMILTALSLAVAAIPEALPAVVTVLLALSARRMVSQNVLIRRLPSVETLGSVTFICSDKTGTLTQNRMRAEQMQVDGMTIALSGTKSKVSNAEPESRSTLFIETLRAAALCNDARRNTGASADGGETNWHGDPTETALAQAALESGLDKAALELIYRRVEEISFDAESKRMTTVNQIDHGYVAYTKGAPESVIPHCKSQWHADVEGGEGPLQHAAILDAAGAMAAQGLRVLAFARGSLESLPGADEQQVLSTEMSFLGLIGLIDPPRDEAMAAVRDCLSAGITPVMITGDHPATALAIAKRLGIVDAHHSGVVTGAELAAMDDDAFRQRVDEIRVYARVDPAQKIRIVAALQAQGEFVAMTGDGVNDAPALKHADIGVAMGRSGTDVAREASSLVLLDDNFATIVVAVREGRRIYDNIRKFVRYALTGNSSEIWIIFLAPFLGLPIPLLPIHILWVNLVTDGLPGLALAAEPAERGIMQRPPRPPQESLFAGMLPHIFGMGLLIAGLCLLLQAGSIYIGDTHWQTMVFTTLTLSQVAYVMAIRSESESLFRIGLLSNLPLLGAVVLTFILQLLIIYVPWLNPVFKTQPLSAIELMVCLGAAGMAFAVAEIEKAWSNRKRG
ncbi:MAG: cation-translocating P-type ATPase [Betaproteobacteria bacterium]|nr:cation-translocating P-type ATPase [Betaproteobacteria bacterium]